MEAPTPLHPKKQFRVTESRSIVVQASSAERAELLAAEFAFDFFSDDVEYTIDTEEVTED